MGWPFAEPWTQSLATDSGHSTQGNAEGHRGGGAAQCTYRAPRHPRGSPATRAQMCNSGGSTSRVVHACARTSKVWPPRVMPVLLDTPSGPGSRRSKLAGAARCSPAGRRTVTLQHAVTHRHRHRRRRAHRAPAQAHHQTQPLFSVRISSRNVQVRTEEERPRSQSEREAERSQRMHSASTGAGHPARTLLAPWRSRPCAPPPPGPPPPCPPPRTPSPGDWCRPW
jgi:hypothetical protein